MIAMESGYELWMNMFVRITLLLVGAGSLCKGLAAKPRDKGDMLFGGGLLLAFGTILLETTLGRSFPRPVFAALLCPVVLGMGMTIYGLRINHFAELRTRFLSSDGSLTGDAFDPRPWRMAAIGMIAFVVVMAVLFKLTGSFWFAAYAILFSPGIFLCAVMWWLRTAERRSVNQWRFEASRPGSAPTGQQ